MMIKCGSGEHIYLPLWRILDPSRDVEGLSGVLSEVPVYKENNQKGQWAIPPLSPLPG